jgi:hypothetical protein
MAHSSTYLRSSSATIKYVFNSKKSNTLGRAIAVALLCSTTSVQSFAAGYNVTEIPLPDLTNIKIPSGAGIRPVCLGINENGQVACNLEVIQTLNRTPLDQLAPNAKIYASYVYTWDSRSIANPAKLLSDTSANTLDHVNVINDLGEMGGSTSFVGKHPQSAIWKGLKSTSYGSGKITALNNSGDYVLNGQLFSSTGIADKFAGKLTIVDAINNISGANGIPMAAGKQILAKREGVGMLYVTAPANPTYALSSFNTDETVTDLTDNGNFVISGTPGTLSGFTAVKCDVRSKCQFYTPTVGASSRNTPWITLNAVDSQGVAVGTDTGIAVKFVPNSPTGINAASVFSADTRVVLTQSLTNNPTNSWFLNEATDSNSKGLIIGKAIHGPKTAAFLLTPVL